MSAPGRRARTGYTLFEMLVVLAILGLIGSLVYPGFARGVRAQQFRGAVATAASLLRQGRARAVAGEAPVRVAATADGAGLVVGGSVAGSLPAAIRARTTPASGILFYGDGSASGGSLTLTGEDRSVRFVVAPATGLVRSAA